MHFKPHHPILVLGGLLSMVFGTVHAASLQELSVTARFNTFAKKGCGTSSRIEGRGVVFISGNGHENQHTTYFKSATIAMKKRGGLVDVPIFPSSSLSARENGQLIEKELLKRKHPPLILVAHSKGGPEALLALLRHPWLIENGTVESLFIVQGALRGAPEAEEAGQKDPGSLSLSASQLHQAYQQALVAAQEYMQKTHPNDWRARYAAFLGEIDKRVHYLQTRSSQKTITVHGKTVRIGSDEILRSSDEKPPTLDLGLPPRNNPRDLKSLGTDLGTVVGNDQTHCSFFCPNSDKLQARPANPNSPYAEALTCLLAQALENEGPLTHFPSGATPSVKYTATPSTVGADLHN